MTNEYRLAELDRANREYTFAAGRLAAAVTKKDRRTAASDLEFWGNKVAFLSNPKIADASEVSA